MRPHLYFPIEIGTRELDARLLTACIAAERGFVAVLGLQQDLFLSAKSLPPGVFLSKGTSNTYVKIAQWLRSLGHIFAACEEENFGTCLGGGGLAFNSPALAHHCDLYLCIGKDEADYLKRHYGSNLHFKITGNARTDVLRAPLRPMFAEEAARIRRAYGQFILINTVFGTINPATKATPQQLFAKWTELGVFGEEKNPEINARIFQHFLDWEIANLGALRRLLPELIQHGYSVVVRPHPGEDKTLWQDIAHEINSPRLHVVYDAPNIPFLMATHLLVHPGCTTGLEAVMMDVPTVSLQTSNSPVNSHHLCNEVNLTYSDVPSAMGAIAQHMSGDPFIHDARPALLAKLSAYLDDPGDKVFSAAKIVDALAELTAAKVPAVGGDADLRAIAWTQVDHPYFAQKFNISEERLRTNFANLRRTLNRFGNVEIDRVADKVYLIRS
jgi:surface carbohydrate biosynthesis protein